MENPDANGFVNIIWPSKSIPHGGVFHTKIVETSRAQQEFLKILLEESKLSIVQRQNNALKLRQEENKLKTNYPQPSTVRPRTSRRRSLSAIRESGVLELEEYYPIKRGEDREKLKDSLASKMAYGDSDEQKRTPPPPRLQKQELKLPTKKEQWNDLVTQIRERAEWLAEMEDLGHAEPHRQLVKDQIAERLRALDDIGVDSARSSARSRASGFSVVPSEASARSEKSAKTIRSGQSGGSQAKQRSQAVRKPRKLEENVLAYEKFSPLMRSPRRRV